jgi:lysyl-tRNA synthetase class 2
MPASATGGEGLPGTQVAAPVAVPAGAPAPGAPPAERVPPQGATRDWRERFAERAAQVILLAAWWSLLRVVTHHVRILERVDDLFALVNLPVGPSLFSAALLFIVGGAVRRRMQMAWWLLSAFQVIAAGYLLSELVDGLLVHARADRLAPALATGIAINAALTVVVVALLLGSRGAFTSRLEQGARWRSIGVLVGGISVSMTVSIVLTLALPGHLHDLSHRLLWAIRVVFGVPPDRTDLGWGNQYGHHWIAALVGALSAVTLVAAAAVFLRSARAKAYLSAQDELAIRGLLATSGSRDSLGYFATRRDKSALFSPARDAAITYRVEARVCLVSADPIGPPNAWPAVIAAWLRESRAHGWFPAVLSASEAGARAYVAAGLKAIAIGDEAIIDTDAFSLAGASKQSLRRAARRIRRAGYTITVRRHSDLSPAELRELDARAEEWRVDETERGFSMALGRVGDQLDGRCVAVLAHDAHGRLRGLLSLVPWGEGGLSLDLMRRDRSSDNGLIEAMVIALVRQGRDELGVRRISLNFAMFRGVFDAAERIGARPMVRLTSRVMRFASRFWQIESLYRSNARYAPDWKPRYLCYDSPLTLTRVALAAGVAEGFVPALGGRPSPRPFDGPVRFQDRWLSLADAVEAQDEALRRAADLGPRLSQQQRARLAKSTRLRAAGRDPYPTAVPHGADLVSLRAQFAGLTADRLTDSTVSAVGRVRSWRDLGKLTFAVLQDGRATIQAVFATDGLGAAEHALLRGCVDLGDLLSVTGRVGTTRTGELSIFADGWQLAAKCLTPVAKLRPATGADARTSGRSRHLELIADPGARELLLVRSRAVGALRTGFARREFVEVETPMLQAVHGGANARPFATHMNAYDVPLYLRIAPELQLKRLGVAGMRRIFELNRNFRNEGVDDTHNPEFTSLEAYQAFADYTDMRTLARELIIEVATAVHGAPIAVRRTGRGRVDEIDLSGPWPLVTVHDAVSRACGTSVTPDSGVTQLRALCREHAIAVPNDAAPGALVVHLYEKLVEARTVEPTFYADFPVETSPLTRAHRDDPRLAERWDLVAFGQEIGTAYSELTDPTEQRRRLVAQSLQRAAGDVEAMQVDEEFLDALRYGLPPTGGIGIGVDRLVMMLTGVPIRDTLAFPFTRRGPMEA